MRPLGPSEMTIDGGFWGEFQELNGHAVIPHCLHWVERVGWVGNFDAAAQGQPFRHAGVEFVDSEVYKLLEAMAWQLDRVPEPGLSAQYRDLVARVAAANVARTLANLGTYFASASEHALHIHQYGDLTVRTRLANGAEVGLQVRTGYPRDESVSVTLLRDLDAGASVRLRVPTWARGQAVLREPGSRTAHRGWSGLGDLGVRSPAAGDLGRLGVLVVGLRRTAETGHSRAERQSAPNPSAGCRVLRRPLPGVVVAPGQAGELPANMSGPKTS